MAPEAVVLKKQEELVDSKDNRSLPSYILPITREEILGLMGSLRDGLIPPGYELIAVDFKRKENGYSLLKEVRNEKLQGLVLEVVNTSVKPLLLKESSFGSHPKAIAVAIKNKYLQPGERTEVYVVRSH